MSSDVKFVASRLAIVGGGFKDGCIISLRHPGLNRKCDFLLEKSVNRLCEVLQFDEAHRCWMIDDSIRSDGKLYMFTPLDPLFIVLPHVIEQCSDRAVPLSHVLNGSGDAALAQLSGIVTDLDLIADSKGPASLSAFKYNKEKTLAWLCEKVERVAGISKKKSLSTENGAVSATFVRSAPPEGHGDEASHRKFAFGMVSQYLEEDLTAALSERLGLNDDDEPRPKRKIEFDEPVAVKRTKTERDSDGAPPPRKQKLDERAARGSMSISAFFKTKLAK